MKLFFSCRKKYVTLLETLIAMSLLAMLLTIVFSFYHELSLLSQLTEKQQKESFQMRYADSRLAFLFERLVNENANDRLFYFYTQPANGAFSNSMSLIFTFNNEARLNPLFAGDVLARLYVDLDQRLCLAIWPLVNAQAMQEMHQEVLLEKVDEITYEFYAAPERLATARAITGTFIDPQKQVVEKNKWHTEWAFTYNQMPSIAKLKVKMQKPDEKTSVISLVKTKEKDKAKEGIEWNFAFVLPTSKNFVYYPPN